MGYNRDIMRFEVPQFIEIEDKIIGPLTWKQFVYVAGGAGLIIMLYLSELPFFIFILLGVPIGALSASLAFHRINNRPFSAFLEGFVNYMRKSKLYLWKRSVVEETYETPAVVSEPVKESKSSSLARLSRSIEFEELKK